MTAQSFQLGNKGVKGKLSADGKKLTIEIDMTTHYGRSKKGAGPNEIVASTSGNCSIPHTNATIGLNIYQPPTTSTVVTQ